jgi:hypothetical protein
MSDDTWKWLFLGYIGLQFGRYVGVIDIGDEGGLI